MLKNKGWSNNVRSEGEMQEILQNVLSTVSLAQIRRAMQNVFVKCDACLRAEGNNFHKHLLQISYVKVEYKLQYTELKREELHARRTGTAAILSPACRLAKQSDCSEERKSFKN